MIRSCPRCKNPLEAGTSICWRAGCLALAVGDDESVRLPPRTWRDSHIDPLRASCIYCRSRITPAPNVPRKWCSKEACAKRRIRAQNLLCHKRMREADPEKYRREDNRRHAERMERLKQDPEKYEAWKERKGAYDKKFYAVPENKARLLERQKEYRRENPEKYKAYARRRYHDEKAERLVVYP